jgi:hypothetical protein
MVDGTPTFVRLIPIGFMAAFVVTETNSISPFPVQVAELAAVTVEQLPVTAEVLPAELQPQATTGVDTAAEGMLASAAWATVATLLGKALLILNCWEA